MPVRFYNSAAQSGLEALAQGAERGIGLGLQMKQMKRQAEQDAENKRRYEEDKARATDQYNRQVSEDVFRRNIAGRQQDRLDQADQRYQADTQSAQDIGSMAVGTGLNPGESGPPDPEHQQALEIAKRLTPESLPMFLKEHEQQQRTKMLGDLKEKHLSQWQDMARNPALGQLQGAGHAEEIAARAQAATEALNNAQTPEQLTEALKTSKEGLEKTTVSIGQALDKQNQLARVVQHYRAGPHGIAEQQAALSSLPGGVREFAQKIVDDQDRLVSAFEAGAITSGQLTTLMEHARNQKPGGGGAPKPESDSQRLTREQTYRDYYTKVWQQQNPPEKDNLGHVTKPGKPVDMDWVEARVDRRMNGDPMKNAPTDAEDINAEIKNAPAFDINTPQGKRMALESFLKQLGIDPNAKAPEKPKGGGKLLRSTGDPKLDEFYASSPK